jgi:hypothetical protein
MLLKRFFYLYAYFLVLFYLVSESFLGDIFFYFLFRYLDMYFVSEKIMNDIVSVKNFLTDFNRRY